MWYDHLDCNVTRHGEEDEYETCLDHQETYLVPTYEEVNDC